MQFFYFCGYDNAGNLFLDGSQYDSSGYFSELPQGTSQFVNFAPSPYLFGPIQWDGMHVTLEYPSVFGRLPITVYQLSISGSVVTTVGKTPLNKPGGNGSQYSWIEGTRLIKPYGGSSHNDKLGFWKYPQGGEKPYTVLKGFENIQFVLVSTSYVKQSL